MNPSFPTNIKHMCNQVELRSWWLQSSSNKILPILRWDQRTQPMQVEGRIQSDSIKKFKLDVCGPICQFFQIWWGLVPRLLSRIASRCTKADSHLQRVMKQFVTSSSSPAQLLQYRPYFAKRFAQLVKSNNGWRCALEANPIQWAYNMIHSWNSGKKSAKVRIWGLRNTVLNHCRNQLED